MDLFIQIALNSIIIGSLYGAVAMSFSLMYRTVNFFNLAHGSMAAIGGYAFLWLHQMLGLPLMISLPFAMAIAGLSGFLIDHFIYTPQRRRNASPAVMLVVSLGIVTIIEAIISMIFSSEFKALTPVSEISSYQIGGAYISMVQIWIIISNILIFGSLTALLYKTAFGRMIRAIADNTEVARILGIRTNIYIGGVFFISSALAGLSGILYGLDTGVQPTMGFYLLLKGVIACIIGCVGSIPGAFIGGFLLAIAENLGIFTLGSEWRDAIAFTLLLIFLVIRPQGLLGPRKE